MPEMERVGAIQSSWLNHASQRIYGGDVIHSGKYGFSLVTCLAMLLTACAPHHTHDALKQHPEIRPLTMPKASTEGQLFQVVVFHGCYDGATCTVSSANLPAIYGDHRISVRWQASLRGIMV